MENGEVWDWLLGVVAGLKGEKKDKKKNFPSGLKKDPNKYFTSLTSSEQAMEFSVGENERPTRPGSAEWETTSTGV